MRAAGHRIFGDTSTRGEETRNTVVPLPRISHSEETQEGCLVNSVLASYAHLHLASNPALAAAFVDQCASFRTRSGERRTATADIAG
jgi:cobyrinic acid a,c-diamide synthase